MAISENKAQTKAIIFQNLRHQKRKAFLECEQSHECQKRGKEGEKERELIYLV